MTRTGRRLAALLLFAFAAAACASVPPRQVPEAGRLAADHVAAYRDAEDLHARGRDDAALERIDPYAGVLPLHVPTHLLRQDLLVALRGRDAARAAYPSPEGAAADQPMRDLLAARLLDPDDPRRDAAYARVLERAPQSVWAQLAASGASLRRADTLEARAVAAADAGRSADAESLRKDEAAATEAALASARAAVTLAPDLAVTHAALADAILAKRERIPGATPGAAVAAARKAAELDPGEPRNLVLLARALRRSGDDSGAAAALESALAIVPDDASTLARLGRIRLDLGDAGGARKLLERAVARSPGTADAWHDLGVAHFREGDADDAVAAFEKALASDGTRGGDPRTLEALALALSALGRRDEAAAAMERYLAAGGAERTAARAFIAEMRGAEKVP